MEDSGFKPFELKEFDSEEPVVIPEEEDSGFHPLKYESEQDLSSFAEIQEKSDDEKITLSESFRTDEFNREDSLLTNAENYSQNIREGAQLYKQQLVSEIEINRKDTERIKEETHALQKITEEEKVRFVEEARAEARGIKDAAYEEGFKEGREKGIQDRYREAAPLAERAQEVLRQLEGMRQVIRYQGEKDLVQLAFLLAKKVVISEIQTRPDLVNSLLKTFLKEIESLGKIRISLHPEDYEFLVNSSLDLETYLKEEQSLSIKPDIDAERGTVHMESDEEVINFHFQKRFEELEEELKEELGERHSVLDKVDIDAYDFGGTETKVDGTVSDTEGEPFPGDKEASSGEDRKPPSNADQEVSEVEMESGSAKESKATPAAGTEAPSSETSTSAQAGDNSPVEETVEMEAPDYTPTEMEPQASETDSVKDPENPVSEVEATETEASAKATEEIDEIVSTGTTEESPEEGVTA